MRSLISAFKYWLQRSYLCSQSYTRGVMEIQMLLVLVAASWMCCGAAQKDELYDDLMDDYVKEVEPPLPEGAQNITFKMSLDLRCATPAFDGLVSIESWTVVVRKVGVGLRRKSIIRKTYQFPRSKSVTSWREQKSVVSVVSCGFPNSITMTGCQLVADL